MTTELHESITDAGARLDIAQELLAQLAAKLEGNGPAFALAYAARELVLGAAASIDAAEASIPGAVPGLPVPRPTLVRG